MQWIVAKPDKSKWKKWVDILQNVPTQKTICGRRAVTSVEAIRLKILAADTTQGQNIGSYLLTPHRVKMLAAM